jgi:cell division protein FtsB
VSIEIDNLMLDERARALLNYYVDPRELTLRLKRPDRP